MLSKVLGRNAGADAAKPCVFGDVPGYKVGADVHAALEKSLARPAPVEEADASLREKIRSLEARSTAERREAFENGRRQGEQQARAELQPVLERLNGSIAEIAGLRAEVRRRAEQDVVQLALLIAKRVLHRELQVDNEALTALARVAFERLTRSESYRVTVHPHFAASVTSALSCTNGAQVHVDADPDCAPGTLIIHSADGTIDASVDTQLEEIGRGLTDRIARVEGD
jgi:flagellar assembly protein FliH